MKNRSSNKMTKKTMITTLAAVMIFGSTCSSSFFCPSFGLLTLCSAFSLSPSSSSSLLLRRTTTITSRIGTRNRQPWSLHMMKGHNVTKTTTTSTITTTTPSLDTAVAAVKKSKTMMEDSQLRQQRRRQRRSGTNSGYFDPLNMASSTGEQRPFFMEPTNAAVILDQYGEAEKQVITTIEQLQQQQDDNEIDEQQKTMSIWAARGILLLVAAIWGTNFASVKYLEGLCFHPPCNHPPSEFAFARFSIAALVSMPLLYRQRLDVILAGLECGLWITIGYVSQAMALATISSGKCAFICSLTVVFVPVVTAILYKKPIKISNIIAAVVALTGVGVLEGLVDINAIWNTIIATTGQHSEAASATVTAATTTAAATVAKTAAITSSNAAANNAAGAVGGFGPLNGLARSLNVKVGDILALGQPIGFGYAFTRIEHVQEQYKEVAPNRVLTIAAAQCVSVGFLSLLWVLYDYHGTIPNFGYMIEPHRIAAIGWTGIVTTVFAIFLEGIALQTATATDAALAFASEPVWASMFGFVLLHETLGINSYVGGTIIMIACLIGSVADLMNDTNKNTTNTPSTTTNDNNNNNNRIHEGEMSVVDVIDEQYGA